MLIQPHLAIFLDRFLRVRTNPLILVLIFLSNPFIHGFSFVINIDVGGGYRPGEDYGYGYDDRVSGTKTNLMLVRNSRLNRAGAAATTQRSFADPSLTIWFHVPETDSGKLVGQFLIRRCGRGSRPSPSRRPVPEAGRPLDLNTDSVAE